MIKIENWLIPFVGYRCLTVWPFLFYRDDLMVPLNDKDILHENIHGCQQLEMLLVGAVVSAIMFILGCSWWSLLGLPLFLYWYMTEWLVKFIATGLSQKRAYRSISFEQEAYEFEDDKYYLKRRRHFAWTKYVFKMS